MGAGVEGGGDDGLGETFITAQRHLVGLAADDDFESVGCEFLHVEHEFLVADVQSITSHYFPLGCQV